MLLHEDDYLYRKTIKVQWQQKMNRHAVSFHQMSQTDFCFVPCDAHLCLSVLKNHLYELENAFRKLKKRKIS